MLCYLFLYYKIFCDNISLSCFINRKNQIDLSLTRDNERKVKRERERKIKKKKDGEFKEQGIR